MKNPNHYKRIQKGELKVSYSVLDDYNLIEKSLPLLGIGENAIWGDAEIDLLEIYLSRINARDKETGKVMFPLSDLEEYRKVDRIRTTNVERYLKNIMAPLTVRSIDDPNVFVLVTLFTRCEVDKNPADGKYWVYMKPTEEGEKYFFNISRIGYVRYRLGIVRKLNMVEKLLYGILKQRSSKGFYYADIEKLRKELGCNTKAYIDRPNNFVSLLNRSIKRIMEETPMKLIKMKKRNNANHEIMGFDFYVEEDEEINPQICLKVADTLEIEYEKAVMILNAANKYGVSDTEINERVQYAKERREHIDNLMGFMIWIMNNANWEEIMSSQTKQVSKAEPKADFMQGSLKDDLELIEKLAMQDRNRAAKQMEIEE